MSDRVCPLCHWIGDRKDCNCTAREGLLIRAIVCLVLDDRAGAMQAIYEARREFESVTGRDPAIGKR